METFNLIRNVNEENALEYNLGRLKVMGLISNGRLLICAPMAFMKKNLSKSVE